MTCLSCDETDEGWDRMQGCIDGIIYGPCEHEHCGGFCEDIGGCECPCHTTIHRDATPAPHHVAHGPTPG